MRLTRTNLIVAFKLLRSNPTFVIGVIAMLVIGVGLATTMFALSDPFVGRPLPYAKPDRLVLIEVDAMPVSRDLQSPPPEYPLLRDWQARTDLFDGLAAFDRRGSFRIRLKSRVIALEAIAVSPDLLDVLGVRTPRAVTPVAGDEIWLTERAVAGPFAGVELHDAVIQQQASGSVAVRGILPPSFLVPQPRERAPVDALIEMTPGPIAVTDRGITTRLTLVGRMRSGVQPAQVYTALSVDAARRRFGVRVTPLATAMKASQRRLAIGALLSGVLVLVVCAVSTLGMALTRGLYRAQQLATMEALGASRSGIGRLLLAEGAYVAAAGTLGALVLVDLLCGAMVAIMPRNFLVLGEPGLSMRVVSFAVLSGLAVAVAWWTGSIVAWSGGARAGLREAKVRDARLVRIIRFGLSASQVAATLVLLAGAGLLGRSQLNLARLDAGMTGDTVALSVSYDSTVAGARLHETIERTIAQLRRVGTAQPMAAVVGEMADAFHINSQVVVSGRPVPVEMLWVSPEYFEAAGTSIVRGRSLLTTDASVVVVNEAFVMQYLGGRTPTGDPVQAGALATPIVGIVRDSRLRALDESARPAVFRPLHDMDDAMPGLRVTYLSRGPDAAPARLEAAIRRVSPDAVILDGATLRDRLARTIQDRTFATLVVVLFAVATVAVTLTATVGAVGYGVARRTREFAVRLALGATPDQVLWLAMRDAFAATATGAGIGLVVVGWLSDAVSSLVYGVSAADPVTLTVAAMTLVGAAGTAAAVTGRRASRLSPTVALRQE